jgi:predicted HD superfamily hydrolase involved in NAD metabolism
MMRSEIKKLVTLKYQGKMDRLKHIKGVVETAKSLAKTYGANPRDAEIAAWFHDYTKYDSIEEQLKFVEDDLKIKYKDYTVMYHAISAANLLKSLYPIHDDIYYAIKYHVWGRLGMTLLEKIVLIADKIEPTRVYKHVDELRKLAYQDLNLAVIEYLKDSIRYHEQKGVKVHDELKTIITNLKEQSE